MEDKNSIRKKDDLFLTVTFYLSSIFFVTGIVLFFFTKDNNYLHDFNSLGLIPAAAMAGYVIAKRNSSSS